MQARELMRERVDHTNGVIRIMVVDDHPAVRIGLAGLLEKVSEFEIAALAANGAEAIRLFHDHRPDITLMDLCMPIMDGIIATESILRDVADARIIILTSYGGDEDVYRSLRAGAKSYILKDTSIENLVDTIHSVHQGCRHLSSEIATKLADRVHQSELTDRELEVLHIICEGKTNDEIASALRISMGTVKTHINRILSKLQVSDRTQAVVRAFKCGLVHW